MPTRFPGGTGLAKQPSTSKNRSDWFHQDFTVQCPAVTSASAQSTDLTLPAGAVIKSAVVNVITAEATGLTKTLTVSRDSNAILSAVDVSAVAVTGENNALPDTASVYSNTADSITYTMGSGDFAELDAEVVISCLVPNNLAP